MANIGVHKAILILGLLFMLALFAVGVLGLIYLIVRAAASRPLPPPSTLLPEVVPKIR